MRRKSLSWDLLIEFIIGMWMMNKREESNNLRIDTLRTR